MKRSRFYGSGNASKAGPLMKRPESWSRALTKDPAGAVLDVIEDTHVSWKGEKNPVLWMSFQRDR